MKAILFMHFEAPVCMQKERINQGGERMMAEWCKDKSWLIRLIFKQVHEIGTQLKIREWCLGKVCLVLLVSLKSLPVFCMYPYFCSSACALYL